MMVELNRFENGIILDALLHMSYRFNFCTQLSNWQMHKKKVVCQSDITGQGLQFLVRISQQPRLVWENRGTQLQISENDWVKLKISVYIFFPELLKLLCTYYDSCKKVTTIFSYITLGLVNGFPMVDISFCSALFNFGFELLQYVLGSIMLFLH